MPVATKAPPAEESAWVTSAEAAAILDLADWQVSRLAHRGFIAIRPLPVRARYSRADVERLAAEQEAVATAK